MISLQDFRSPLRELGFDEVVVTRDPLAPTPTKEEQHERVKPRAKC